jgi:hypothetical protein
MSASPGAVRLRPDRGPQPAPAATPPSPGMVWVNAKSKVYHTAGYRWYGKTKNGQWMTEDDAIKAGYRKSKQD